MIFSRLYHTLSTPEKTGNRIGLFRILCAIFGGLAASYSAMTLIVLIIPARIGDAMLVAFLFTPLLWSCAIFWIFLAPTKLGAILRWGIPSIIFTTIILMLFKGFKYAKR